MTEEEWLTSTYPTPMLEFLQGRGSKRKLRLFACACCRHEAVWRLLHERSKALVEAAERFADQGDSWERVIEAASVAPKGGVTGGSFRGMRPVRLSPSSQAERAVLGLAITDGWEAAWETTRAGLNLLGETACQFLRDVFGNPCDSPSTIDPNWLRWNDATIVYLAQAIHDEQAFDRLPVLSDALEEAGCTDLEILAHCREPGVHVLGCWVTDLLLGKE